MSEDLKPSGFTPGPGLGWEATLPVMLMAVLEEHFGRGGSEMDDAVDALLQEVRSALGARSTGGQLGPGTPPDTSWNKRASPPGGEWQGIETAPRDGTWIDVWVAGDDELPTEARARRVTVRWGSEPLVISANPEDDEPGWLAGGLGKINAPYAATHWMPLPAPPREAVGVGIEGASRTESGGSPPLRAAKSDSQEGH